MKAKQIAGAVGGAIGAAILYEMFLGPVLVPIQSEDDARLPANLERNVFFHLLAMGGGGYVGYKVLK